MLTTINFTSKKENHFKCMNFQSPHNFTHHRSQKFPT